MRDALGTVQSVLVLGGGSEIAQATVQRLVADGCRTVVLAARRPEALGAQVEALRSAGATTVDTVGFDALDPAGHVGTIDRVWAEHPDIDVVLLAFGVLGDQAAFDADPVAAAAAVSANYGGAVSAGLAVAKHLKEQGHGSLVVLSSVAGERVRKSNFVYGSSKAGLDGFAHGLGDALVGTGASVLVVRPGFVHSKMTEGMDAAPFATTPDAVAQAIVEGLRKGKATVWAPPVLRYVFSVFRHLPRPLWRIVSSKG
jgi:decaprenylphospho-beta-D-erythro-pentofuranosid-2-ulose 2-reductase